MGVPPGFEVITDNLQQMVETQEIMKFETIPEGLLFMSLNFPAAMQGTLAIS